MTLSIEACSVFPTSCNIVTQFPFHAVSTPAFLTVPLFHDSHLSRSTASHARMRQANELRPEQPREDELPWTMLHQVAPNTSRSVRQAPSSAIATLAPHDREVPGEVDDRQQLLAGHAVVELVLVQRPSSVSDGILATISDHTLHRSD